MAGVDNAWQDIPEDEWDMLIEGIDPDWTDHFFSPEQALEFYNDPDHDRANQFCSAVASGGNCTCMSLTQKAVKEYRGE